MLEITYFFNAITHYRRTFKKQKSHSLNDYDLPTNKSIIYQSEPEKPLDIYIVSKICNIVKYTFNIFTILHLIFYMRQWPLPLLHKSHLPEHTCFNVLCCIFYAVNSINNNGSSSYYFYFKGFHMLTSPLLSLSETLLQAR